MEHIVIIGNGIAGITAARHIRKRSNYRITIISGESEHFYSRTALMYLYMGHLEYHHLKPYEDHFWKKNRIDLVHDWVTEVDFKNQTLTLKERKSIQYDKLILATGSSWRKGGWPGENLSGVTGMYGLPDLEAIEKASAGIRKAVVVGGGLIGVELAEMLHSRGIQVSLLVRDDGYWRGVLPAQEAGLVGRHLVKHGIDLRLKTSVSQILGDEQGRVKAVLTPAGEEIACQFVGVTIGVQPNIDWLKATELETDRGILVDEYMRTNLPNVFAIGDCAQHRNPPTGRPPVEQVWYTGRQQGLCVAKTLCGEPTAYQPGVWFNSAKFFDIEYQIYGTVPADPGEEFDSFYWQSNDKTQALRLVWRKDDKAFVGVNLLGIRYRQEVCEGWIKTEVPISEVVNQLGEANFDPEFHKKHEEEISETFIEKTGIKVARPKKKKWYEVF